LSSASPGRALTRWLRWIAASALLLIAGICTIGAIRAFTHDLPDSTTETGVSAAVIALVFGTAAFFLLRPEIGALTPAKTRDWLRFHPLGQALAIYVIAALGMVTTPSTWGILFVFAGMCAYSGLSPWTAATRPRWWASAIFGVIGWLALFGALISTAEALAHKNLGTDAMVLMLPMMVYPVLLAISGLVHWSRRRAASRALPPGPPQTT
jgi:hypothetical protein